MPEQLVVWKPANHLGDCSWIACSQRRLSKWRLSKAPPQERTTTLKRPKRRRRWRRRRFIGPVVRVLIAVSWFGWRTFKWLALMAIVLTFLAVFFFDVEDPNRFIRTPEEVPTEATKLLGEVDSFLDGVAESLVATPVPTSIIIRYPNDAQLDEATIEQWVVHCFDRRLCEVAQRADDPVRIRAYRPGDGTDRPCYQRRLRMPCFAEGRFNQLQSE